MTIAAWGHRRRLGGVGIWLLLACVAALAQDAPKPEEKPADKPPTAPAGPKTGPGGEVLYSNLFTDTDVRQALSDLATQTGAIVIPDSGVQGLVSVELKDVPVERALDLLSMGGGFYWEMVEKGVYLVTSGDPKAPAFLRLAKTQAVGLQHITAADLKSILPDAYVPFVKTDDAGNRAIVTAPPKLLANIVAAISGFDVAGVVSAAGGQQIQVLTLENLQAAALKDLLPEALQKIVRFDPASNRVIVYGPPKEVQDLIIQLKALDGTATVDRVVALKNITGPTVLALVPDTLKPYVKTAPEGNKVVLQGPPATVERVAVWIEALDQSGAGGAAAGPTMITQTLELSYLESKELIALLPKQYTDYVKVNESGTKCTIMAPQGVAEQVVAQIKELDQPPLQVMIEALMIESDAGALDQFRLQLQGKSWSFDNGLGTLTYSGEAQAVLFRLLALAQRDKAKIMASPRVVAQEGKEAKMGVTVEQYFQIITVQQNYQYVQLQAIEAPITLSITPRVAVADRMVTCKIAPTVSEATGTGANNLPIITKRTAETTVRVKDGEVIAIGGLLQETERETRDKIPFLGDLPLIGGLFTSRNKQIQRREVTIFIVPHILDENGNFKGPLITQRQGLLPGPPAPPTADTAVPAGPPPTAMQPKDRR